MTSLADVLTLTKILSQKKNGPSKRRTTYRRRTMRPAFRRALKKPRGTAKSTKYLVKNCRKLVAKANPYMLSHPSDASNTFIVTPKKGWMYLKFARSSATSSTGFKTTSKFMKPPKNAEAFLRGLKNNAMSTLYVHQTQYDRFLPIIDKVDAEAGGGITIVNITADRKVAAQIVVAAPQSKKTRMETDV